MRRRLLAWALALGLPLAALGALSTTSVQEIAGTTTPTGRYVFVRYRCDNSAAIAGDNPIGGEVCATGNWWPALNAQGARAVSLYGYEYGSGSGEWSLWNCMDPAGSGVGGLPGVELPGVEDPNSAPSSSDPDPLCTRINVDAAGATVPLNGIGTKEIHFSGQTRTFGYLIVRTEACTDNCDASLYLAVTW